MNTRTVAIRSEAGDLVTSRGLVEQLLAIDDSAFHFLEMGMAVARRERHGSACPFEPCPASAKRPADAEVYKEIVERRIHPDDAALYGFLRTTGKLAAREPLPDTIRVIPT